MLRRDKGLTELVFLVGLLILPLDSRLWEGGLPVLLIASAIAYSIAWELPHLWFQKRVGSSDQFCASFALTLLLLCFYIGRSDKLVAQMIERQGQASAFNSPFWKISDGVLFGLTIAVMMTLLALTTLILQIFQPDDNDESLATRVWQFISRNTVGAFFAIVIGFGGGAWAITVSTNGLGLGISSWVAMWVAVRVNGFLSKKQVSLTSVIGAMLASALTSSFISLMFNEARLIPVSAVIGGFAACAHATLIAFMPKDTDEIKPRPKDAPFYVPWVGFYTTRFIGLLVAFFTLGATSLWGLR